MYSIVQASKYQAETISLVISFADVISAGDSITGIPTITVTVASGSDPNPSNLLYQGVTVTNGNTVEQHIRLGLPGVIYTITFTIATVGGDIFEKESLLAIRPDEDNAVPNWLPYWQTTQLYPYQLYDALGSTVTTLIGGRLVQTVYSYSDSLTGTQSFVGGTLIASGITYSYDYDSLTGNAIIVGGILTPVNVITYSYDYDSIQTGFAVVGGTLIGNGIIYSNDYDSLTGSTTLISGTLA
jgi:hypothetical protein